MPNSGLSSWRKGALLTTGSCNNSEAWRSRARYNADRATLPQTPCWVWQHCEATRIRKANPGHQYPFPDNWRHNASWRQGYRYIPTCCSQRLLSLSTILCARHELGWKYPGSAYCQLIRQANKEKRFEWAHAHLHDNFEDVLWTDKSSVQLQCHKRFCCKKGEQSRPKPRAKHPVKVHVWAGIGWHGATEICIFDVIMDAAMYVRILQVALSCPPFNVQTMRKVTVLCRTMIQNTPQEWQNPFLLRME